MSQPTAPTKYTCYLTIKAVSLSLPTSLRIFVVLKQDDLRLETSGRILVDPRHRIANFYETFTFPLTLNLNPVTLEATEKKARIGVYAMAPSNKVKVVGECVINLSTYCSDTETHNLALVLQNCPDKKAYLELSIKLSKMKESMLGTTCEFSIEKFNGLRSVDCSPGGSKTLYGGSYSREGSCERIVGLNTMDFTRGNLTLRTVGSFLGSAQGIKNGTFDEICTSRTMHERNPIRVFQEPILKGSFVGHQKENIAKTARGSSKENVVIARQKDLKVQSALATASKDTAEQLFTEITNNTGINEKGKRDCEVRVLKAELEKLRGHNERLASMVKSLKATAVTSKATINELKAQYEEMKKKEQAWNEEKHELLEKVEAQENDLREASDRAKFLADTISRMEMDANVASENERKLLESIRKRDIKINEMNTHAENLNKEAKDRATALESHINQLEKKLAESNQSCENAKNEADQLKYKLEKRSSGTLSIIPQAASHSIPFVPKPDKTLSIVAKWEQEMRKVKQENAILRDSNKKSVQELARANKETRRLKEELTILNKSLKTAQLQISDLTVHLSDSELLKGRLEEKKLALELSVSEYERRVQLLEADLIRTKQDLAGALNAIREFEAEHMEFCGVFERSLTFKEGSP